MEMLIVSRLFVIRQQAKQMLSICTEAGHRKETCPAATTRTKTVRLEHVVYVNSELARWSEQPNALGHWLEEDLSAQEIEQPNLIKAMVTLNPMGEPEDGDWGGGRSGRSNGGCSDGDWGDRRRSRSRHSK